MCRDECPLKHIDIHSFVLNFAGNKTQTKVDEIQIAKVAGFRNLLSCDLVILVSICHKLHLKRHLRLDHHVGRGEITMYLIILVQCANVLPNFVDQLFQDGMIIVSTKLIEKLLHCHGMLPQILHVYFPL